MSGNFEFQYPWLLALLLLLPVYSFFRGRVGKLSALRFPSADIARAAGASARAAAGRLLLFLRLLTAALCIVALAGPRFATDHTETQASGVDIMLVLDLSWSMMALDMAPESERVSRYDIAAQVLEDFIRKRPSDRLGLIVFSAVPYLASPLTLNHDWLIENLHRLHVGLIRDLGTAIGDATAAGVLSAPVVIVLEGQARRGVTEGASDGVDVVHAAGEGDDTLAALAASGPLPVTLVTADRGLAALPGVGARPLRLDRCRERDGR